MADNRTYRIAAPPFRMYRRMKLLKHDSRAKHAREYLGLSEVLLKISMMMKHSVLLSVVLCTALFQSAYADSEIVLPCAQQYPGDDAARLKCYDRLAAPASAPAPAARENTVPDENSQASTAPAAAVTPGPERSYLTKAWNLDDLSNRDQSKLGRIQPYRQTYLLLANLTSNPDRPPQLTPHRS